MTTEGYSPLVEGFGIFKTGRQIIVHLDPIECYAAIVVLQKHACTQSCRCISTSRTN